MDSLDDSYLLTGYEPNAYDLKETYVESYTESLTNPQFSKRGSRTWSTMTPHSRICFAKHTEYMSITLSEKSVSRRRACPSERGDLLESERGDLLDQNWDLREAHGKSLKEMEELKKFQSSTFDTIAIRTLVEDQDTILVLTGKIQDLRNEINCMNDLRDFQDAESINSGNSHVTSRPVSFPPHPIPEGMVSRSFGMPSRREGPPSIWDTLGISGNIFANPDASSSALYPQELNQWNSSIEELLHSPTVEKSERQKQDQDLRCQSGPSAKNSVIFSGGDSSKNYGTDQQRLQISDLLFDKFPSPATFACWKKIFKTEVCTCSQFPTGSYAFDRRSGDG